MEKRTERQQQQTVFLLSAIAGGCGMYFHVDALLYVAILLAFVGAFSLLLTKWIDFGWMRLAWVLGAIVPRVILSAVFYLLLTPIALLSRIFGDQDPLLLKKRSESFFKVRVGEMQKSSFEKPW